MEKRIVFKNMPHSTPMEDYANQQMQRIFTFLERERSPIYVDLFLEPSQVHAHHRVELRIKTPHFERSIHYECPDMYEALDRVCDTMYLKLHDDKKQMVEDRKSVGRHDEFKKQR